MDELDIHRTLTYLLMEHIDATSDENKEIRQYLIESDHEIKIGRCNICEKIIDTNPSGEECWYCNKCHCVLCHNCGDDCNRCYACFKRYCPTCTKNDSRYVILPNIKHEKCKGKMRGKGSGKGRGIVKGSGKGVKEKE